MKKFVLMWLTGMVLLGGVNSLAWAHGFRGHGFHGHGFHHLHGSHFGFSFGFPLYWGPYPYYYPYGPPVYVERAPVYIEREPRTYVQEPSNYWYYCPNPSGYYPYVQNCSTGWLKVVPSSPPQ